MFVFDYSWFLFDDYFLVDIVFGILKFLVYFLGNILKNLVFYLGD